MMWEKPPADVIHCVFIFFLSQNNPPHTHTHTHTHTHIHTHKVSFALQETENGWHKLRPEQLCLPRGHKANDQFTNQGLGIQKEWRHQNKQKCDEVKP